MRLKNVFSCLTVAALAHFGAGAYPSLEHAQQIYSQTALCDTNVSLYAQSPYLDFVNDLHTNVLESAERAQIEHFLVSAMTSIVVNVSSNGNNEGISTGLLRDRGSGFRCLSLAFRHFPTNSDDCVAIASYVGTVRPVECQDNLVGLRFHRVHISTNSLYVAQLEQEDSDWRAAQALQTRMHIVNKQIKAYRKDMLEICNIAVAGCRATMPNSDFAAFTNQLVTVSGADEVERYILFKGLDFVGNVPYNGN